MPADSARRLESGLTDIIAPHITRKDANSVSPKQNYGGYGQTGRGGYGQTNPYEQDGSRYNQGAGNPYAQDSGNPYAQQPAAPQPSYGGGRTQQPGYDSRPQQGGYDNRYGGGRTQAPAAGGAAYGTDASVFHDSNLADS